MTSESCQHEELPDDPGRWLTCPECSQILWRQTDGGPCFFVPSVRETHSVDGGKRRTIVRAIEPSECADFDKGFILRTRLNLDLDYITGQAPLSPLSNSKQSRTRRIEEISERIGKFGLTVTRLLEDGDLEKNEPIWIHRRDFNPRLRVPSLTAAEDDISVPFPDNEQDSRWGHWRQSVSGSFANMFGEPLYPRQIQAIESILKPNRSLTIVGLPTGFGKTRIAQVATYLIRNTEGGDRGPTLIISPLISLMDDQRIRWSEELNEKLSKAGEKTLKCRFLTSAETRDKREIIGELLRDEIDVLCCSPESILKPRKEHHLHWIGAIQKMKNPFSLLVVDEAHTIADWGASIRPEFQLLDTLKRAILRRNPSLRVLLMSATITEEEDKELRRMFDEDKTMRPAGDTIREPDRNACATRRDLAFDFRRIREDDFVTAVDYVKSARNNLIELDDWNRDSLGEKYRPDGRPSSVVVFTRKKKDARGLIKSAFKEHKRQGDVVTYTGSTGAFAREATLRKFLKDEIRYLVATSAFGMGVDKRDVWLASYLGQPYTLKGLYQAFGRAARDSGWDDDQTDRKRSGLCIGRFYGKSQPFNPRMGIKLSMERIYDLLSVDSEEETVFKNGYLSLDLLHNPTSGWSTNLEIASEDDTVELEDDTGQDEYDLIDQFRNSVDIQNQKQIERIHQEIEERRKKNSSLDSHINLRMWVLSCLERTGAISIMGVHPEVLGVDEDGRNRTIHDLISKYGSYPEAIDAAQTLKKATRSHRSVYVIRINRSMGTFEEMAKEMDDGIHLLKKRHQNGLDEMSKFMSFITKRDGCIRKAFAGSVGRLPKDEATCIESIRDHNQPVMPCSNCRSHPWLIERNFPQDGPLFSTPDIMRVLSDHGTIDINDTRIRYFRIHDTENIHDLSPDIDYELVVDEFEDLIPPQGAYILIENGSTVGKVKLTKTHVTFSEIDRSGLYIGYDYGITFRYDGKAIIIDRGGFYGD